MNPRQKTNLNIEGLHHSTKLKSLCIYKSHVSFTDQPNFWEMVDQMPFLEKLLIHHGLKPPKKTLQNSKIKELSIYHECSHKYYPGYTRHYHAPYPHPIGSFFRTLPQLNALQEVYESCNCSGKTPADKKVKTTTRKDLEKY